MKNGEGNAANDTDINIITLKEEIGFLTLEEYTKSFETNVIDQKTDGKVDEKNETDD